MCSSSGRLLKIEKYRVDSKRQCNLLLVFSWEAIKITAKLISPPQMWTEMGWSCTVLCISEYVLLRRGMTLSIGMVAPVVQMFLSLFYFLQWKDVHTLCCPFQSCQLIYSVQSFSSVFRLSGFLLGYVQYLLRRVRLHLYLQWDQEAMLHHTNTATITNLTKC